VQEFLLEEVERAVIGLAESFAGLDHLVEDRLESLRAGDGPKDAADRALLLARVLEPAGELGVVRYPGHPGAA
jgi:hypothetical protein